MNYQQLVESLRKQDDIIQKQFNHQDIQLACHCRDIEGHQHDIQQLADDQVTIVTRMTNYKSKACHCREESGHLSHLSYGKPPVAPVSGGPSFPGSQSPVPIPIPPPATGVTDPDVALPSSSSSDSDKENSSPRSFKSTRPIMTELVEIQEVSDEEAQVLLDEMDAKVRSCLYQRCRSKNHPEHFAPYPKG